MILLVGVGVGGGVGAGVDDVVVVVVLIVLLMLFLSVPLSLLLSHSLVATVLARGHKTGLQPPAYASVVSGDEKGENGGVEGGGGLSETIEGHSHRRSLRIQVRLTVHLFRFTMQYFPSLYCAAARCHALSSGAVSRFGFSRRLCTLPIDEMHDDCGDDRCSRECSTWRLAWCGLVCYSILTRRNGLSAELYAVAGLRLHLDQGCGDFFKFHDC